MNNDIPKTAPPVDQWVGVQGIGVPVSSVYGPEKREGDLFTCYQHSPTGALFAAAYTIPGTSVKGFADNWTIPGTIVNKEIKRDEDSRRSKPSNIKIVGYSFNYYSPESTSINLIAEVNTPQGSGTLSASIPLEWSNNRWNFAPKSKEGMVTKITPNSGTYTLWGPNA
ncbi:hypothetical protein ACUH9Y_08855 [Dermabacteraceae bacterium P13115]